MLWTKVLARIVSSAALLVAAVAVPVAAQQTGTIRGTVRDANTQTGVPGAQVGVVGTRIAVISDAQGNYTLPNVPVGRHQVRVRMLSYSSALAWVELRADELTKTADFALNASVINLDEIVVTGTGTATAIKQLGNSIGGVDSNTLRLAPVQTFSEGIAAREPGVQILPSSGLTGEGARIRIRGNASLSQSNEPVVYVDGVRVDNAGGFTYVGAGGAGTPSRLDDINPETIERVEILKGAAAATLYGSEANAGVIQIFTKKGTQGRPRFSFRTDQGILRSPASAYKPLAGFARYPDFASCLADSAAFGAKTDAQTANCRSTIGVADRLSAVHGRTLTPFEVFETGVINDLFGTGFHSSYSGNVTGGGETALYNIAARYTHENGAFTVDNVDAAAGARDLNRKYFGSANLTLFPRERFQVRAGAMFTDVHHETPNNSNNIYGVVSSAINAKPEQADCEESRKQGLGGTFGEDRSRPGSCAGPGDAWGSGAFITAREAAYQQVVQDAEHFNGNVNLLYQAHSSVKLDLTLGVDLTNATDFELLPFRYNVDLYTNNETQGRKSVGSRNNRQFTIDGKATWAARLRQFSFNTVVGTQGFITRDRGKGGFGRNFPGPGIEVAEAGSERVLQEYLRSQVNLGALAQEQIGYNDWAFLTLGARWDRNSAFGEQSPWAFYPKVGLSVVPSDLPTWSVPQIATLRVRAALGKSGLQPGAFDKFNTWSPLAAETGPGLQTDNLGNDALKPEVSTEWEVGGEIGVLNNRVSVDVTRWHRNTADALVAKQPFPSGGYLNSQLENIGEFESKGWDLKLNALVLDRPDLSVNLFVNGAHLVQRILSMGGAAQIKVGGSYPRYRNFLRGPDTLYSAPGVISEIRYYAPGALLGAEVIPTCAGNPRYRGGANVGQPRPCYTPGQTVPYDTDRNRQADTEARLAFYMDSLRTARAPNPLDLLNPMMDDEDGDRDVLDHYQGKSMPDWQGAFGGTITFRRNLQLNLLLEYKGVNYTLTNLTDGFRKSHPGIGRNVKGAAEVEATLLNPASRPEQRLAAAMEWANTYKALSPYDGLNQNEKGDFLRWRELGITYSAPAAFGARFGLENVQFSLTGRNVALWTGYSGIDPEQNTTGRGGQGNLRDDNYLDGVDGWGLPLPTRWTFSVRFGF